MLSLLVALTARKSYINAVYRAIKKLNYCRTEESQKKFSDMRKAIGHSLCSSGIERSEKG